MEGPQLPQGFPAEGPRPRLYVRALVNRLLISAMVA